MPSPIAPNDIKDTIPAAGGSFCEKLLAAFQLPRKMWDFISYMHNEDGTFTDEFKADLCALGCVGSATGTNDNPVNANMPAPSGISASDGSFSDKIRISWNAVTAPSGVAVVTQYKVYRALATVTDPNSATLIATVDAPTVQYDDPESASVVEGTNYHYWVKATNGTDESNFGGPDVGYVGTATTTLSAVSDLQVSKGYDDTNNVSLVFSKITGANTYSIYRHTSNTFGDATEIESKIAPESTDTLNSGHTFYDNDDHLVYFDTPPSNTTQYFYWVKGHRTSPPADSPESNSDSGFANQPGLITNQVINHGDVETVPAGSTTAVIVLQGSGAGGAGGGLQYGGGGGGGGALCKGEFAVTAGNTIRIVATPSDANTGNAANQTNGSDSSSIDLQLDTGGGYVTHMTANVAGGGVFNASGGGAGGAGATGDADVAGGTTNPIVHAGYSGGASAAGSGGKSGVRFGNRRFPPAHYDGFDGSSFDGSVGGPGMAGSGCASTGGDTGILALAEGGFGVRGRAIIYYLA